MSNTTTVGANAKAGQSNSLVLGNTSTTPGAEFVNVGIGTSTPRSIFEAAVSAAEALGDAAASGTYRLVHKGVRSTLILRPDHSFRQEVSESGGIRRAEGTWRRLGEGGVAFSRDFLTFPGEQRGEDGTAYSDMQRTLGIFIHLSLRTYQVAWYGSTDPARTDQLAGRYQETEGTHSRTLVLNPDHTFDQTVTGFMQTASARGTWTVAGNGDVVFSREFIKPSEQPLTSGETAKAMDPRGSRFLQIEVAADEELTYYKKLLPW